MEFDVFCKKLKALSNQLEIILTEEQAKQFYDYMNLLLEWNEKINLTAITDPEEIILKHFIDSITIAPYLDGCESMVDVGTGAGFPGIPIKILMPEIKVVLLDSLQKRILFLQNVIEKLHLTGIEAIHARVEEFGKNKKYRESFDIATSRAVANLAVLSEYLMPLVKLNGNCICMKGSQVKEEVEGAKNAIKILGGKLVEKKEFCLPNTDMGRTILVVEKVVVTPNKYPRKAGTPAKEPIV